MSRSYKHTPVYKGGKDRYGKRRANKIIRRKVKLKPYHVSPGKSNRYRKAYESWNICDYRFWGGTRWRGESGTFLRETHEVWQKYYRRK